MAVTKVLRTYRFMDKDPVCDVIRTCIADEGLSKKLNIVADLASLAHATVHNILKGHTKKPQNATAEAILSSLGYERTVSKVRKLNVEEELPLARAWNKRELAKRREARGVKVAPRKKKRKVRAA